MTREKIREGMVNTIMYGTESTYEEACRITDSILMFQDIKGVVLKVERELPTSVICFLDDRYGKYEFAFELEEAGYVAAVPLVEE